MMSSLLRLIAIACVVFSASDAYGQSGDWYVSGSASYADGDPDRAVKDDLVGGQLGLGRRLSERLALEAILGHGTWEGSASPLGSNPDQATLEASVNLLVFPFFDDRTRDWSLAPYVFAGVGYLSTDVRPGDKDNKVSGNLGLGIRWRIGQSKLSIRAEGRVRVVFDSQASQAGPADLTDRLLSVGLQYDFGKKEPVAIPEPRPFIRAADSDGDRIPDSRDACPDTPRGVAVSRSGCPLDSDGDGVTSDKDRCPGSRPGAIVDEYGCERDNDNDGVPDHLDLCLGTAPGARIDTWGCEIKNVIRLPGVNFETGSDRLVAGTELLVEQAAATLKKYPELEVEVAGHTDSVGTAETNLSLSERRAKTVRDFLVRYGVDEARLSARGYGEGEPVASNETAASRAENRRVELRIVRSE